MNADPTPAARTAAGPVPLGLGVVVWAGVGAVIAALAPRPVLIVVLLPVQVLLAASWLAMLGTPARGTGLLIASASALAADLLLSVRSHPGVGALAGVVGLAVVAAVVGQLPRTERSRVTDVLAAQCSAAVLTVAVSPLFALADLRRGDRALAAALTGVAFGLASLTVGSVLARAGRGRGASQLPAILATGFGAVSIPVAGALDGGDGMLVSVGAAVALVAAASVAAAVGRERRVAQPLVLLLPFAAVGPVAYLVGRLVLG